MTIKPCADPIPPEARAILRRIAAELRETPGPTMSRPAEVSHLLRRVADRIEGVAALNRPAPSPRAWRVDGVVTRGGGGAVPRSIVTTTTDGREVRVEKQRSRSSTET